MEFLRTQLSKSFLDGDYRKHQMTTFLSEGMSTLGELQRLVPLRLRMDEKERSIQDMETYRKEIFEDIRRLQRECWEMKCLVRQQTSVIARQKAKEKRDVVAEALFFKKQARKDVWLTLYETRRELDVLRHQWRQGQPAQDNGDGAGGTTTTTTRNVFFMACPRQDCRGRLSTAYKCGLCEHWCCPDCHGDKGLERSSTTHRCDEGDKKTVALLKENTKPCPKCHEGIFKVSGCDQMWCTQCHTCFSWQSGKILNGVIHNPHFYAWQRDQHGGVAPRVPGDDPCGGGPLPPFHLVMMRFAHHPLEPWNDQRYVERSHRLANHLVDTVVVSLRRTVDEDTLEYRRKWGVEYLRGQISKEEWAKKLYFAARRQERKQRILFLMEMVVGTMGDLFRSWPSTSEVLESLRGLFAYANEQIDVQNRQYGTCLQPLDPMADNHYMVS
jgi:hypothetical protein